MNVQSVLDALSALAPPETAEEFDNVGLLVGHREQPVTRVLVALDITDMVIDEAAAVGAELIVSHHPVIYAPLKAVTDDSRVLRLAEHHIAAICMHTCLDKAEGGVNDALLGVLGMKATAVGTDGYARVGRLENTLSGKEFARYVAERLGTAVRYHGEGDVSTVAVIGGSGGDFLPALLAGEDGVPAPDAVVTGEIRHHQWLAIARFPQVVIEAGHYATEYPVVGALVAYLSQEFTSVIVTAANETPPYRIG